MEYITLHAGNTQATICPYGAQVLSYTKGETAFLWHTTQGHLATAFTNGKALRGGIPLCWPWFGNAAVEGQPNHGYGRIQAWELVEYLKNMVHFQLELAPTAATPAPLLAETVITLTEADLRISLTTTNIGSAPCPISPAFHPYVQVEDVRDTKIIGLEHLAAIHLDTNQTFTAPATPLRLNGALDAQFHKMNGMLQVTSPARTYTLQYENCPNSVVWNPWEAGAKTLDMPTEEYQKFICVEGAAGDVLLQPNQEHTIALTLKP